MASKTNIPDGKMPAGSDLTRRPPPGCEDLSFFTRVNNDMTNVTRKPVLKKIQAIP